jgi:hypothetical protein
MEDTEIFKVKVTNRLTGEITEHVVKNMWDAKELYLGLSASETATKNAKKQLSAYLNSQLGQDNEFQFADGKILRRVQRETRVWTIEGLKSVGLDEDTIAAVSKVDMKMAQQVVTELIERGDIRPDAKKTLLESADVNATAPFVEIR